MEGCGHCGDSIPSLAYKCNYCGQTNCSNHRLPEKHDCIALHLARPPESSKGDARLGELRDFRKRENFIEWIESFRENLAHEGEGLSDRRESAFREALEKEAPGASTEKIDSVITNVEAELDDPSEKSYSVFEPEYTVGNRPDPNFPSSPDVNPDGTMKSTEPMSSQSTFDVKSQNILVWKVAAGLLILLSFGYFLYSTLI